MEFKYGLTKLRTIKKQLLPIIEEMKQISSAFITGSCVKGHDNELSDIDAIFVFNNNSTQKEIESIMCALYSQNQKLDAFAVLEQNLNQFPTFINFILKPTGMHVRAPQFKKDFLLNQRDAEENGFELSIAREGFRLQHVPKDSLNKSIEYTWVSQIFLRAGVYAAT